MPTNKVTSGTLAGALSILLVWILAESFKVEVPNPVAQSLTVILTFVVSYFVRDKPSA